MNAFILPKTFITVLAALVLAALMATAPTTPVFAGEVDVNTGNVETSTVESIIVIETKQTLPSDPAELRRLLSTPQLSAQERHRLERVLEETYEELA